MPIFTWLKTKTWIQELKYLFSFLLSLFFIWKSLSFYNLQINSPSFAQANYIIQDSFRWILNGVGFFGLFLIVFELKILIFKNSPSKLIIDTDTATYLSTLLTLLGTIVTVASIYYFPDKTTPPEKKSVFFTAPFMLSMCIIAMYFFIRNKKLPPNIINGFALVAIVASLLRIQINPSKDPSLYCNKFNLSNWTCGEIQSNKKTINVNISTKNSKKLPPTIRKETLKY
jgi:hypothetical protein